VHAQFQLLLLGLLLFTNFISNTETKTVFASCSVFLLFNIALGAYILGTITLLLLLLLPLPLAIAVSFFIHCAA
jgi:hypothetical protein